jgi:hypothetical protein
VVLYDITYRHITRTEVPSIGSTHASEYIDKWYGTSLKYPTERSPSKTPKSQQEKEISLLQHSIQTLLPLLPTPTASHSQEEDNRKHPPVPIEETY